MHSYIKTDNEGNFTLDGHPWFLHAAVYFGRRPGTCGADWMGENFAHNMSFLDKDIDSMHKAGINTLGLFIPSHAFLNCLEPVIERFEQLSVFLDKLKSEEMRAIIFDLQNIEKEDWCKAHGIGPDNKLWHPALNPEAEKAMIASKHMIRKAFADRPEIIGWATGAAPFTHTGMDVLSARDVWSAWLCRRFDWDFERVRQLFDAGPDEYTWERIRMPVETKLYYNCYNPRSYEFSLMHHVLVTKCANRIIKAVRGITPNHLMITPIEGCDFSNGELSWLIPEDLETDALWPEVYHWEGMRSYQLIDDKTKRIPEPVTEKPSTDILNAVGYVQMMTRLMKRKKIPVIMCHGTDIGEKRRGVRNEEDQKDIISRYNRCFLASGGNGIAYWCWNDDELSKTYTSSFGLEYDIDSDLAAKKFVQAGETMGIVRYDGSPRPVIQCIKQTSEAAVAGIFPDISREVLVLLPAPVFLSTYRYRANQSAFGLFTSLARQGILSDAAMTSFGERLISYEELRQYRFIVLGASSYRRDYEGIPEILLKYVENGGTLFLALGSFDTIIDPYLTACSSLPLKALSGCRACRFEERSCLKGIRGLHAAFNENLPENWCLEMDETVSFAEVKPLDSTEVLAAADDSPLLLRHKVGAGNVYVFTWNLDVFIYQGKTLDHYSDQWDWIWKGIAHDIGLKLYEDNKIRESITDLIRKVD